MINVAAHQEGIVGSEAATTSPDLTKNQLVGETG
jgi:hypothetical protein